MVEVPCESVVTEKVCARKAQFVCPNPPLTFTNGFKAGAEIEMTQNLVLTVSLGLKISFLKINNSLF